MRLDFTDFTDIQSFSKAVVETYPFEIVIDNNTLSLLQAISKDNSLPLLITGETGTGKEEVAKVLRSLRGKSTPFVAINCAHLQGDLTDSVLFGHRKGSFSGATENRAGLIEMANGGVLFLDEIHHLSLGTQAKLLRTLNDGTYNRLGCSEERFSKFQVVAATNRDFDEEVENGRVLLDLRMRLIGYEIHLRSLRERLSDIPAILAFILRSEDQLQNISWPEFCELSAKCQKYYWRGNIRQLVQITKLFIRQSHIAGNQLESKGFPELQMMLKPGESSHSVIRSETGENQFNVLSNLMNSNAPLSAIVDFAEEIAISNRLNKYKNLKEALVTLEISRSTLENKRKKFDLRKRWGEMESSGSEAF